MENTNFKKIVNTTRTIIKIFRIFIDIFVDNHIIKYKWYKVSSLYCENMLFQVLDETQLEYILIQLINSVLEYDQSNIR